MGSRGLRPLYPNPSNPKLTNSTISKGGIKHEGGIELTALERGPSLILIPTTGAVVVGVLERGLVVVVIGLGLGGVGMVRREALGGPSKVVIKGHATSENGPESTFSPRRRMLLRGDY